MKNPQKNLLLSKIYTLVSLGVALFALKEMGGTLGYDRPRMIFFGFVLAAAVIIGLVTAVAWRYFSIASKNTNEDAIAVETLSQLGKNKYDP